MPTPPPTRGVIFDLDGTLLDSIDDLADSMNATLAALRHPARTIAEYKTFVGDGVAELVRRALPEDARDEALVQDALRHMRAEYAERWDHKTRPYPGIPELLDALAARGLRLAVLTNKLHDFALKVVERLLPADRFDVVLGETDSLPRKPDPAGALHIARKLDIAPEAFAYLGDTDTDMRTAMAAGMFPIGVLWGFRGAEELRKNGARALIERPGELMNLLPPA